jgi:hypothetical protein
MLLPPAAEFVGAGHEAQTYHMTTKSRKAKLLLHAVRALEVGALLYGIVGCGQEEEEEGEEFTRNHEHAMMRFRGSFFTMS